MSALAFVIGLIVGGGVAFVATGVIQGRRFNSYEIIITKLRRQNRKLADALPEESRKDILGYDRCVCCGDPIPKGQMVCTKCMEDEM